MLRHYLSLISISVAALLLASCASRHSAAILNDVETYIQQRPDSALAAIRAIDTTTLTSRSLRAHYALLRAMALDKNWIDTTNVEVVMPAVRYYEKNGTYLQRSESQYYLGRIQYNGSNYADAIVSFTRAEKYSKAIDDYRFKSLIFQAMGDTYGATYLPEESLRYTDSSIVYCYKSADSTLAFSSLYRKAQVLNNLHRYGEADSLFRHLLDNRDAIHPKVYPRILADYALFLATASQDYRKAVDCFEEAIALSGKLPGVNRWGAYAYSLYTVGKTEKAESIFRQLSNTPAGDTYAFKVWKSRYEADNNRYRQAYEMLNESYETQVEGVMKVLRQSVVKAQRDFFALEKEKTEASRQLILVIAILSVLLLIAVIVAGYLILRRKNKRDRQRRRQLEQENASLQEAVTALSDKVTEMNVQQAQLQREYTLHLQSSFREWGQLYKAYYHPGKNDILDIRENVYYEATNAISRLSGDKEGQILLERRLNELFDDVMVHYRADFPDEEESDYHFVSFVFAGFDASILKAAFQIPSIPATYARKSRLKESIQNSSSLNKEQYLRFFR